MFESKDEERRQKAVLLWRRLFNVLWNVSRLLVLSMGIAALTCINGIGNAGNAPELLRFYATAGGAFSKGWLISVGVAGLAYLYRSLDPATLFTAKGQPKWYRLQMRYPWLTQVDYVMAHVGLGCLLLGIGLYLVLAAAPLPILAKMSGEFGTALACDAEYRTLIGAAEYKLTDECQKYLEKQGRLQAKTAPPASEDKVTSHD